MNKKQNRNVRLVLDVADLCRMFTGGHCICCKSGKDRTSMAVTLEESRFLCGDLNVIGGRKACKIMRRFGTRRQNVLVNTDQTYFAFNFVQQKFLPACYRPPGGTFKNNVAT